MRNESFENVNWIDVVVDGVDDDFVVVVEEAVVEAYCNPLVEIDDVVDDDDDGGDVDIHEKGVLQRVTLVVVVAKVVVKDEYEVEKGVEEVVVVVELGEEL